MTPFLQMTQDLASFIKASPSCYHVVANIREMLLSHGVQELQEQNAWDLQCGSSYFVTRGDSSIIAFRVPEGDIQSYQIIASHSDAPTFKIKEHPEMPKAGHYIELNIERYGGMLSSPWFDRPLSIAGRIMVRKGNTIVPQLISFDRDLLMIPSLAIHMNPKANEGTPLKVQSDLLPILGDESTSSLMDLVSEEAGCKKEDILGNDLFLYVRSPESIWGAHQEYFSSPKLDDLQCAYSSVRAFLEGGNDRSISVCCVFDNEEVGSSTKQGADSSFLSDTLERITDGLYFTREQHLRMISNGFMLSADNGHAVHPNHPEKADPTNQPYMNGGVVIKYNANQRYTTDGVSAAIFRTICEQADVPTQIYVNHSDVAGGSTLGNISNNHVSMNTIDIGCPQLAMHSPYETCGVKDTYYLHRAMSAFYSSLITRDENGAYTVESSNS